jgi:L-seryl-tRNA(Ser) seleniumtransferase
MSKELLRSIPSIDSLLARSVAERLAAGLGRGRLRNLLREITDELREELAERDGQAAATGNESGIDCSSESDKSAAQDELIAEIERRLEARARLLARPSLRRVINATGVIIHTNLGRAPLPPAAAAAVVEIATHYSNLEYDLERGGRGRREHHCEQLLSRLVGSEAAVVTNNNAAAVLLVLNTLAEGGEAIVSRGELIEIGGSFRIPEIMAKSNVRLREVGTTNRTRIGDYEKAVNENTRLILRVHPSNYRIVGFTERPELCQIVDLGRRTNIPTFEDLGSGCLLDLSRQGVRDEPIVAESLAAGVSVVSFSGDKLLGGPQAGIIAGTARVVERVRSNPLMRALRVDKMTYAALEATLRIYERGSARGDVPVMSALTATREHIAARAEDFVRRLVAVSNGIEAALEDGESVVGGGSAPDAKLPTVLVALRSNRMSGAALESAFRHHAVPIITRTDHDRVLIDLRTVAVEEESMMMDAVAAISHYGTKDG